MIFGRRRPGLPEGWEDVAASSIAHWQYLDDDERAQMGEDADRLLRTKHWEAARGFELTDEIRVVIAVQASLLVLGLGFESYREVKAIVVHPTTMVRTAPRAGPVAGVVVEGPLPILGEAAHRGGPITIAWDAASDGARHPERGFNVVYHEFAHKLDMLNYVVDGTPPLADEETRARWIEVCTDAYERVRAGTEGGLLRDYAGVNPGEFFAVATEVFFDIPDRMRAHERDLYEVLSGFYRQDPASRLPRHGHGHGRRG